MSIICPSYVNYISIICPSSGLGFLGGARAFIKKSLFWGTWMIVFCKHSKEFDKVHVSSYLQKRPKRETVLKLRAFDDKKSHLPGHPFSSPATEGRYQNRGSKKCLWKAQLVQSLKLSAALLRKAYGTETAATFWQQNCSQGRRPKRVTVSNSTSARQQFCTLETASLQSVEL